MSLRERVVWDSIQDQQEKKQFYNLVQEILGIQVKTDCKMQLCKYVSGRVV